MKKHIIASDASLLEALDRLNGLSGGAMTLFVTEPDGKMTGTLTDGDIRRALLGGASLDSAAANAAMRGFRFVTEGTIDAGALRRYRSEGIVLIPVLDGSGHLKGVLDLSRQRSCLPLKAVLMAGGKGERLRPLTEHTPKPLLQIEGKAIIDYNVEALAACGITDISVTTRYLAEQIERHFEKPVGGVMVKCVCEDSPCGTIGAVALTDAASDPDGNTLVMNSDLLTTISFEDFYLHHRDSGADITVAVVPYQVSVPFAILALDPEKPDFVSGIEEKPSYSYYANAGIYIFSNKILQQLVPGKRCDATDLISDALKQGARCAYFPIKGTWIDVGSHVDFRQAAELMRHHNSFNS